MIRAPLVYVYRISMRYNGKTMSRVFMEPIDAPRSRLAEVMEIRNRMVERFFGDINYVEHSERRPYGTFLTRSLRAQINPVSKLFKEDDIESAQAWVAERYCEREINSAVIPNRGRSQPLQANKRNGPTGRVLPVGIHYTPPTNKADGKSRNTRAYYVSFRKDGVNTFRRSFRVDNPAMEEKAFHDALNWLNYTEVVARKIRYEDAKHGFGSPTPNPNAKGGVKASDLRPKPSKKLDHRGNPLPTGISYVPPRLMENGAPFNSSPYYRVECQRNGSGVTKNFNLDKLGFDKALDEAKAWRQSASNKH